MKKTTLEKIKEFAEENWSLPENEQFYVDDEEFAVSNPWIDHTGRFPLDDAGAVKEWGLDVVTEFCEKAKEKIKEVDSVVLCGFVWCHGKKDFSAFEVNISEEDQEEIEKILEKYSADGTSERNCYDSRFSEIFCEEYTR